MTFGQQRANSYVNAGPRHRTEQERRTLPLLMTASRPRPHQGSTGDRHSRHRLAVLRRARTRRRRAPAAPARRHRAPASAAASSGGTCSTLVAPAIGATTVGRVRSHASATEAGATPAAAAIARTSSAAANPASVSRRRPSSRGRRPRRPPASGTYRSGIPPPARSTAAPRARAAAASGRSSDSNGSRCSRL